MIFLDKIYIKSLTISPEVSDLLKALNSLIDEYNNLNQILQPALKDIAQLKKKVNNITDYQTRQRSSEY